MSIMARPSFAETLRYVRSWSMSRHRTDIVNVSSLARRPHRGPWDSSRIRPDCSKRVAHGGSWQSGLGFLRSASRLWFSSVARLNTFGFRVGPDAYALILKSF